MDILLSAGHMLSDIRKYTPRQMLLFSTLYRRRVNVGIFDQAIMHRLSAHAEGKAFKEFLEGLRVE